MIKYKNGYPKGFSIEKPMNCPYVSSAVVDVLKMQYDSGDYYGELKLNEARSFLCIDDSHKATVYTYRHSTPTHIRGDALQRLEAMDLPPSTVLDGGHLYRKQLKTSKLWVFDVLIWNGKPLKDSCEDRCKLLDHVIKADDTIWRPLRTENWLKEFEAMMAGNSQLIKKAAKAYNVPYDYLITLIEGLVMKDRYSKLSYPKDVKAVANFFKIRLADLPDNLKPKHLR